MRAASCPQPKTSALSFLLSAPDRAEHDNEGDTFGNEKAYHRRQSCPDSTRHRITSRPGRRFVGVCDRDDSRCFPRPSRALPLRGAGAMERRTFITSSANPRLKNIRRLRRCRRGDGAFLVEGFRQVACALEMGASIRELYFARELALGNCEADLAREAERLGATVLELGGPAF